MTRDDQKIHPVILSGGSGTRLWPVSRSLYPKQLMPLHTAHTMLQETVLRVSGDEYGRPTVVCNDEHRFIVAEQLRALGTEPRAIILEPFGRNTAPAAAVAAISLMESEPDACMLLLPSDHLVRLPEAFREAVAAGLVAAREGALVTFGITPDRAETGYGYIQKGAPHAATGNSFAVAQFTEKPDAERAAAFITSGDYFWNSGIFLIAANAYLEELERNHPTMVSKCREALSRGQRDLDFLRLEAEAFGDIEGESIDYAVMEQTEHAVVVPVEMGWNDVGSWSALWDIAEKDENGNYLSGDVITTEVKNSYIRADNRLVAAAGLEDLILIATDDAVMAASMDHAQSVKDLVDQLKAAGRDEHIFHTRVYRPWGWYQTLDLGERFQVKLITVNPGERLSLQLHHKRAEHWVVVSGTATVTRGEETFSLAENESTFLPIEIKHRLENAGNEPLRIIEVQSGVYLGEDDIVRFDDEYGRD